MIMQLIQHQNDCNQHANTPSSNSVCMTVQVECIINNPVKLVTLNHVNLCNPQLVYLYTQTQLYKFIISSPNRDPYVAISQ